MNRKLLAIGGLILAAILVLTGCAHAKSYPNQITLVVGNGAGDNHRVKKIAYPGESVKTNGDEEKWYLPAGARNFVLTAAQDHGDRHTPAVAYTSATNTEPRMQNNVYLTTNWSLNENEDALKKFAIECGKYTCYDTSANEDHSSSGHSSSAGWMNMLSETISPSIDRAVQDASADFGPTLWSDRSQWSKFAEDVSKHLMVELRTNWRTIDPNVDFFCGNGETTRTTSCEPIQVIVDDIQPSDPRVKSIAQDRLVLEQQQANNDLQVRQAQKKYGADWAKVLGDLDRINTCNAGRACTVIVGNTGTVTGK